MATLLAFALVAGGCSGGETGTATPDEATVGTTADADPNGSTTGPQGSAGSTGTTGSSGSSAPTSGDDDPDGGARDDGSARDDGAGGSTVGGADGSTPAEGEPGTSDGTPGPGASADDEGTSPLAAAMLTLDDLPDGWERVEEPEDDGSGDGSDGGGDGGGTREFRICDRADFGGGVEFEAADDVAGAVFRRAVFGPYLTSLAATLPSGQVEALLTELDDAGRSCRTWTQTDEDGNETVFTIAPIAAGELGDQTIAFALTIRRGVLSFDLDLVLWRVGDVGAGVLHAAASGSVDRDLTLASARLVSRRLLDVLGDGAGDGG